MDRRIAGEAAKITPQELLASRQYCSGACSNIRGNRVDRNNFQA
jgi:hypothetical protein